ncbi:uncharacterized protein BXZ73DRAFT_56148, partial [Epithele typhae]|uniref:uncharacterized protein n=1 Tax=Epithele typhae TaxID=378194 RepID=UPI0020080918
MASTEPSSVQPPPEASPDAAPSDLVLLVFIHGFKGDDSTFRDFPQRLQHIVSESLDHTLVESIVFPAYEVRARLLMALSNAAVVLFADWLTEATVRREVANGGAGKAKIVLCGHSMGGLLAADALIEFVQTLPDKYAPLWPNIVACLAYDTPYLGLHPHIFKNQANQAVQYVSTASSMLSSLKSWGGFAAEPSSPPPPPVPPKGAIAPAPPAADAASTTGATSLWQKWAAPAAYAAGAAILAGAAAGAVYSKPDVVSGSYTWVSDHMKYVGNLWSREELEARLLKLFAIQTEHGVLFHTFFTLLPPRPPNSPEARTFTLLPPPRSVAASYFAPNTNTLAEDEIQAHTGMFGTQTNDGYYELGLSSAKLIREAV